MTALKKLEERIETLEREVAILKDRPQPAPEGKKSWLDLMWGSMSDYPDFDKVVRYGREFRKNYDKLAARERTRDGGRNKRSKTLSSGKEA
ncbi:MAG: hypothetical protein WD768_00160 [Phycisphaeraceae bacterium]